MRWRRSTGFTPMATACSWNELGPTFSEAALDAERPKPHNHWLITDEVIHAGLYLCGFCSGNSLSSASLAVHSCSGGSPVLRSARLEAANLAAFCPFGGF